MEIIFVKPPRILLQKLKILFVSVCVSKFDSTQSLELPYLCFELKHFFSLIKILFQIWNKFCILGKTPALALPLRLSTPLSPPLPWPTHPPSFSLSLSLSLSWLNQGKTPALALPLRLSTPLSPPLPWPTRSHRLRHLSHSVSLQVGHLSSITICSDKICYMSRSDKIVEHDH
ncbi:hypothetical protein AMTRI_Chr11g150790 [Amborella trichopoda]